MWQNRVPELTGIRTGPPDVETLVVLERKTRLAGGLSEQGEVETADCTNERQSTELTVWGSESGINNRLEALINRSAGR